MPCFKRMNKKKYCVDLYSDQLNLPKEKATHWSRFFDLFQIYTGKSCKQSDISNCVSVSVSSAKQSATIFAVSARY